MERKYFKSWSGYSIPFKPQHEILKSETESLDAFYIGIYENGVLVSFEKIYLGEREWIDRYIYWEGTNKLKRREMEKATGEVIRQDYDRRGKEIPQ